MKRLAKDEKGYYILLTTLMIGFCILPVTMLTLELSRYMIGKAEARILSDAIALSVANESPRNSEHFEIRNICNELEYSGDEYYLDFVGGSSALNLSDTMFVVNKKSFSVIENKSSVRIDQQDNYRTEWNHDQRIPQSTKSQPHFPTISVSGEYSYKPMVKFFGNSMTIKIHSETQKNFKAVRVENNYNPPLACLQPPSVGGAVE